MFLLRISILATASATLACTTPAQAWPDYRGPGRNGHAPGAGVPLTWSETENVRYKTAIPGTAWSSPVVGDGRVWMSSASADGKRMFVVAVDLETGAIALERTLFENQQPERKNRFNSYASPSPTIEPGRVYMHFGTYGTACLDTTSGKVLWQRDDIRCDHLEGPGSSPILFEDLLIFNVDGADVQYVIALDKATGRTRWQTARSVDFTKTMRDGRKAFSTPVVVQVDGKPRILSSGALGTMAYDPHSGKELWRIRHAGFSMSARPVIGDGVAFLNTGYMSARLLAVDLSGTGDVTDRNLRWTYRRQVPRMSSAILVDDLLYMVSDDGVLACLDSKTGERVWHERLESGFCASPVYANGRLYFCDREGRTLVIRPGRKFDKLAENRLDTGMMACPAVVGDAFLLRTKTHLYRIEAAAPRPRKTADWSRFRGPNGTGVSEARDLPVQFGPQRNVVWKAALPAGVSSPVLAGGCLFITATADDQLFTCCLDRQTGKVRWRRQAPRPRQARLDKRNSPAAATPVADRDTVVVFFEDFGLLAYDHEGQLLWQVPLGPFDNEYGMGASPILWNGRVFLACDQATGSYLLAVDQRTGKVLFKTPRPHAKSGHCTPVIYQPERGAAQLVLPGSFELDAYDSLSGARVWFVRGLSFEMKSTPVLLDGTVYINGYGSPLNQPGSIVHLPEFPAALAEHDADHDGLIAAAEMPKFRGAKMFFGFVDIGKDGKLDATDWSFLRAALASKNGMLAISAGGQGDMTSKSIRWSYHRSVPQLPSPLLYHDVLYMLNDQGGLIVTMRPGSGEVLERGRLKDAQDNYYASPVAADGKVFLVSEGGLCTVLPAGGSLTPLATNDLDGECRATPAIADNRLFIRTSDTLYCFGK